MPFPIRYLSLDRTYRISRPKKLKIELRYALIDWTNWVCLGFRDFDQPYNLIIILLLNRKNQLIASYGNQMLFRNFEKLQKNLTNKESGHLRAAVKCSIVIPHIPNPFAGNRLKFCPKSYMYAIR